MKPLISFDEILLFAINSEQEAVDFYTRMSEQSRNTDMKQIFRQYAHEEAIHKNRLMSIREQGLFEISENRIRDLQISDYAIEVIPGPDMTYADALLLAMKKEKAAFRLYQDMAAEAINEETKSILLTLAQEEAKHELRFEQEYDKVVLRKI